MDQPLTMYGALKYFEALQPRFVQKYVATAVAITTTVALFMTLPFSDKNINLLQ